MKGVLWITVAAILYAALHSFLASTWSKRTYIRIFGRSAERYYRLIYNILGVLTFLPVLAIGAIAPGQLLYRIPYPWSLLFTMGQGLGALLIIIGLIQTDIWSFLGLRQLVSGTEETPYEFNTSGLYRFVRHPLYTAGLLFIWFVPIMTTTSLALTVALSVYLFIGSYFEERRLLEEFGERYRKYQSGVPRIIPSLKSIRKESTQV